MKKYTFLLSLVSMLMLGALKVQAQDYPTAAGLKFGGYEIGPSIKWFADEHTALEGIAGFRSGGFAITGLYEVHTRAFNVDKLNFFYGGGAHLGSLRPGSYNGGRNIYDNNRLLIGADGVVGLEYLFPGSPIVMSVDLDPRIEFATGPVFDLAPALGIKYSF
ncbi:hypothetical protein [Mucilaginibacter ginkgonis]|uniref:Outer membrane protein with beta-barrel domain n=1 Tax=Mucilaginibacter ginkgonis TaxID=2682091 RepID=A0A6I4HWG2_9SPHI|nr:hypothetical protein [Mucilaginibacter ginkgonis]QQL50091.1 hypothetical protein GO620_001160 [Mucilaginibacter ginkgonis]